MMIHIDRHRNEIEIARQDKILAERMEVYNKIPGCRVGDWIRERDGRMTRATHDWNEPGENTETIQHGGSEHGQYYLGFGYLSYSGGLDTGIKKNMLKDTGEMKDGKVWFFIDDYHTAHNGIEYMVSFRVFEVNDRRPISVKSGIRGCINCNTEGCSQGSKYEKYPDSEACAARVFAGDEELCEYINSQY